MKLSRLLYIAVSLFLGVVILVVSVARAGLEIMAVEKSDEGLRNNPVKFVIVDDLGIKEEHLYKLPEVGLLPTNPFYGFKKLRDLLWIKFSGSGDKRARVELLVADKRMAEAKILLEENKGDVGLDASQDALDTLKLAERSISKVNQETDESKQIHSQIFKAGFAYITILKNSKNSFDIDGEKYNQLIKALDEWNKKQKSQEKEEGIE